MKLLSTEERIELYEFTSGADVPLPKIVMELEMERIRRRMVAGTQSTAQETSSTGTGSVDQKAKASTP